jgi:hypothetical protein
VTALRAGANIDKTRSQYFKPPWEVDKKTNRAEKGPCKEPGGFLHSIIFFDLFHDFARALIRVTTRPAPYCCFVAYKVALFLGVRVPPFSFV